MPNIVINESRESRGGTVRPPSEVRVYTLRGTNDQFEAYGFALNATPQVLGHINGILYRQDLRLSPMGFRTWKIEIPYGPRKKDQGTYQLQFDTTGGTLHITNSRATVNRYTATTAPKAAPDMGGAIGVRGDQIDGVDITIPALKITIPFTHPDGFLSLARIKHIARLTGKMNSRPFLTFAPGEILFLGATGSEGPDVETAITYQFAASENVFGQVVGNIVGVAKYGWDHAWIYYEDEVANSVPIKRPRWLYTERVYAPVDLAFQLGFGG